ncbi:MAG: MFS transporter [Acidobacteria bacterium]|nr:MFS transporter [Acidobacteriota bacterium]
MAGGPAPTTRQRVREVLAGQGFRRFFAARSASQLGDGIFQLAAADILIFKEPGSNPALRLAAVTAITLIPFSAIGPFVGVFIDRWDRRRILTLTPALRALLAALLPAAASSTALLGLVVLVVLSANRFFLATMGAALPQLVPEDDLLVANSVASAGGSVANVVGLAAGSALSKLVGGPRTGLIAAAAFLGSALLARLVRVHRGFEAEPGPLGEELREVLREMVDGIRQVRGSRRVVYALSSVATVQVLVGAMTGSVVFYFVAQLGLSVDSAVALLGSLAVGIGVGVALVPFAARAAGEDRVIPLAFGIAGVAVAAAGAHLSRGTVAAGAFFVGVSYAFAKIPVDTIVQEEMPDAFRGRAFAVYDMLFNLARVGGVAVVAVALGRAPRAAPIVAGIAVAYLGAMGLFLSWERRLQLAGPGGAVDVSSEGMRWHLRGRRAPGERGAPGAPGHGAPGASAAGPGASGSGSGLLEPGEMVIVRSYAGARADEEPRAVVVGGSEIPVEEVEWRAVEERGGERRRIFVVRIAGARARLAMAESTGRWEVERILPIRNRE